MICCKFAAIPHVGMICPPGPPCGPISSNEKVEGLLQVVKPQIQTLKEKLNMVSHTWKFHNKVPNLHGAGLFDGRFPTGVHVGATPDP